MNTRKRILLAVANGCCNTRQIAEYLGQPLGTINSYFYHNGRSMRRFKNGDLVQWKPGKANTLRLGPELAVIRHNGKIVDVGKVEEVDR